MARRVNAGHEALRQSESSYNPNPEPEAKLIAKRPHPSVDGHVVRETWGRGSEQEMHEKAEKKRKSYPDHYTFVVKANN